VTRTGVVHVIGRLNVGGPARLVTELARAGQRTAVAAGAVQDGEIEHRDLSGVDLHRVTGLGRKVRPTDDARALSALTAVLRAQRPAIVHTHTAKGGALGRAAAVTARVPSRVHTFHGHLLHGYFGARATAAVVATERLLATRTDRLVAVGERVRDDLLTRGVGRAEQYSVIPPGARLRPLPPRDAARAALGLSDDVPVVAYVGRLAGIKRPERVVEVARRLPDAVFVVVGDGAQRAALQASAGSNVRFLGWRDDVETVWAAADLALLTSDNEGMPVTLVEAALAGLAAVTTDVGSAGEVVLDGVTGRAVPADVPALVEAVSSLLADDTHRRCLGSAAGRRASALYSVEVMVASHLRLYAELAD
jgi:glycosyltransferase involved in cell wall biosynthesis